MALGEAFVEVHADLRPFARDLRRAAPPIVEAFERELNRAVGNTVAMHAEGNGERIGDQLTKGMKNSITKGFKDKNIFVVIAAALGSALDDGISALPTEVKAAIVGGIILAAPILAAFLTSLLVASIGVGVAGLGILLGAQFESVQTKATEVFRGIRNDFVNIADDFEPALLEALETFRARMAIVGRDFERIFDVSAGFVEPLVQGIADAISAISDALADIVGDLRPFIDELGAGFAVLGDDIGDAMRILTASGEDGVTALRDLFSILGTIIVSVSVALTVFTKLYGVIRDVVHILNSALGGLSIPLKLLDEFFQGSDKRSKVYRSFINSNFDLDSSFRGLVVSTQNETKQIKDYQKALEDASEAVQDQLSLNISWEESLDRIAQSLKENGDTLDISTEKGRENAREILKALQTAEEQAIKAVQTGQMTADQAVLAYDRQTQALRSMARQAGLTDAEFDALFKSIIETSALRISSSEIGVDALTGELIDANGEAARLFALLQMIMNLRRSIGAGAVGGAMIGFSEGGIVNFPQVARVAEDGPEVIIPLTKPGRAAQLLQQSGLDKMLGGSGPSQILVFIGNEQLDSRMVTIVERSNTAQALALNHGDRRF